MKSSRHEGHCKSENTSILTGEASDPFKTCPSVFGSSPAWPPVCGDSFWHAVRQSIINNATVNAIFLIFNVLTITKTLFYETSDAALSGEFSRFPYSSDFAGFRRSKSRYSAGIRIMLSRRMVSGVILLLKSKQPQFASMPRK